MNKFIAMNRFKIAIGRELDFEDIWKNRDTHLEAVIGFKNFNLLKGLTNDEYTLYTSHSTWNSRSDFENWKNSEAFRKAHSGGGEHQGIYLGHPKFEGFEVIL
ncbi:MAG: antibiotic biosynthesis monooxygenase family protein [Fidelibacterota bacterium]|jgi:heme-degrading monooxygenase HmoA|nr:antibiotic biosynthesis monooxygenase [Candidatus Neomarinimicrobiota bacterium]|tara:strand:+ start:387 stop:695 length:309 start_codon:yes stop_codon:yes gene_type:complete